MAKGSPGTSAAIQLQPRFGAGSADRHRAAGAVAIPARVPSLRQDVDVLEDPQFPDALPPGRRTGAVLARRGNPGAPGRDLVRP